LDECCQDLSQPHVELSLTIGYAGVSLITQALYLLVFVVRYMDLLWTNPGFSYWNFTLKILYISTSAYIVFLMMKVFARTRERERAWKLGGYSLLGSLVVGPVLSVMFEGTYGFRPFEMCKIATYGLGFELELMCCSICLYAGSGGLLYPPTALAFTTDDGPDGH